MRWSTGLEGALELDTGCATDFVPVETMPIECPAVEVKLKVGVARLTAGGLVVSDIDVGVSVGRGVVEVVISWMSDVAESIAESMAVGSTTDWAGAPELEAS